MKATKTILKYLGWIGFFMFLVMYFLSCGREKDLKNNNSTLLEQLNNQGQEFTKLEENIVEQNQMILKLDDKTSTLLVENEELRKEVKAVQAKVKFVSVTNYDTINLPVDSGAIIRNYVQSKTDSTKDSLAYALALPYKAEYESEWLDFKQKIDTNGVNSVYGISTKDSIDILFYRKKKKFHEMFNKPEYLMRITNHNPHSSIQSVENVVVDPERTLLEKPGFWGTVGTVLGFITGVAVNSR